MQSTATTPAAYIASLPPERRKDISALRTFIKKHLPKGYAETMQYGMITYVVPLSRYPAGYLNQKKLPIPYLSLASQKNYIALHLLTVYGNAEIRKRFTDAWKKSGKKLDMGKGCVRIKNVEGASLDAIAVAVGAASVETYVEICQNAWKNRK